VKRLLLAFIILLPSCVGLGARRSSFEYSDGRKVVVYCQSDGKCQDGNVIVDNRGPVGQVWAAGVAALGRTAEIAKEAAR